jgi:hypothetical protein
MKTIPLGGKKAAGRVALVDDEDYELVSQYTWHVLERRGGPGRNDGPYAQTKTRINGREVGVFMHKLLTGYPMTDHRNGDGLDNQRHNLRPATTAQNNHNQSPAPGRSSPYKGVHWHKGCRKWQAAIRINGKKRHLGLFASEEDAARTYAEAALAVQGEYAFAARDAAA